MRRLRFLALFFAASAAGCAFSGRVIDTESGRPLSGVTVSSQNGSFQEDSEVTDEEGCFHLSVPTYVQTVSFRKDGYTALALNRREFIRIHLFRLQRR